MDEPRQARAIALYLPQFHPIPENDEWWGAGFTEWTNTARAKTRFPGHYQPHVPADLGFYDLRLPEARAAQAAMAKSYGIEAFCYYHYWFAGRRVLERPFNEVVASGEPDFPFCLCWANESWTGIWHGVPGRTLIEQTYPGLSDHRRHFDALLPAFTDRRYVRVDGKPVFLVYQPTQIPDVSKWCEQWNEWAVEAGLPGMHLVAVSYGRGQGPILEGFDARVLHYLPHRNVWFSWSNPVKKIKRTISQSLGRPAMLSYRDVSRNILPAQLPDDRTYPTVVPNWDNSPRSGERGLALLGSTPELFGAHLRQAVQLVKALPADRRFVFIKSWNEWAEEITSSRICVLADGTLRSFETSCAPASRNRPSMGWRNRPTCHILVSSPS